MDIPVVEMEEGGGVGTDLESVIDAAFRNGNVEVVGVSEEDEGKGSPLEDNMGVVNGVEEMDEVTEKKVMERPESSGRKKRKDRENGGDDAEHGDLKGDRKKRKNEKSRRKGRESGDGRERRDHRGGRDRKDSKKDRKERREERDERRKQERELMEETEGRAKMDPRSIALVVQIEEDDERQRRDEREYDFESRYSRSRHGRKVELSVPGPSGTEGRQFGFVLGSVVKPVVMDDDEKEEGEILDDEGDLVRMVESDPESGEIPTTNDIAGEGDFDVVTHTAYVLHGKAETNRWNLPPEKTTESTTDNLTVDHDGKNTGVEVKDESGRLGQVAPTNALHSMLVIAEAYDSESPVSEERNGLSSVLKAESRRHVVKRSENGSHIFDLAGSDRKSFVEKSQDKVEPKRHSVGPPEQQNSSSKDGNVEEVNNSTPEDSKTRSSHRNATRAGSLFESERSVADKPKSTVSRYSDTPEHEDPVLGGGSRGNYGRRRRSPSPKEVKTKDRRRGRSRSKERRVERGRSRSNDSLKRRESSRKKSRSPEPLRERSSLKARSPSRESLRDRRVAVAERFERRKRSRSRDSGPERRQSRDKSDSFDRRRRSKSREESGRFRSSARGDSIEKRRRSRSRDSQKDKNRDVSRRADSVERMRRSRSRSIRDRRVEGRLINRHADGLDKRHRSKSIESLRDRKVDVRDRRPLDDFRHRSSRDDRSSRDGRHHEASRGNMYRTDRDRERDRDRNYNNAHDRGRSNNDSQIKESHQSVRDSMAAEALREDENQEEYQERVASQLAAQEEDDVDRVKEESRKRRQAILEKYRKQQQKPGDEQPGVTDEVPESIQAKKQLSPVQVSAPPDGTLSLGKGPTQNGTAPLPGSAAGGLGSGSPKSERSADMFCDDIFGESPAGGRRLGRGDGLAMDTSGLIDNWDDAEGYYCFRIGEVLDGRYEVASSHGRGVFSTVVRARDMKASGGEPEEVAIKIIRNNETMYKAGQQELVILKKLAGADPENKRHCVRLLSSFEYRSHLCLVFESLHMNLREILKKFGRNIGINLTAVRAYAKQLFISLKHLRNCGVLHCDIKPDNMLVNESKNVLKLCDFGSAMFAGENEITPYLVSRFYRAPEIILGLPYDHALDIWSVGCCLYELYTGKMLFPGHTNNDMLRLHMELKGSFPKKMLKKAAFADQHFDQDFNFCAIEEDPVTKKAIKRIMVNVRPRDMGILVHGSASVDEDTRMLVNFKDLLEKIFTLDPDKRLTVSQALSHSFISGK